MSIHMKFMSRLKFYQVQYATELKIGYDNEAKIVEFYDEKLVIF